MLKQGPGTTPYTTLHCAALHLRPSLQVAVPYVAASFQANVIYTFVCNSNNADGTSAPSNRYNMLMCAQL